MNPSFEIISPVGVLVRTFDCPTAARQWVLKNKTSLPGLSIHEVTVTVSRRVIYQPRRVQNVRAG